MPRTINEVRIITGADRETAISTLSAAFYDDPVFRWITPDDERRAAQLPVAFGPIADALLRHGASVATDDGAGVALWVPPGKQLVDEAEADAFEALLAAAVGPDAERMGECLALMEAHHPQGDLWYLNLLAVAPGHQGQGIGSALLRTTLERSDLDGVPSYLEATTERNRALYERHGFSVIGEIALPDGPSMWPMWRDPR